MDCHFTDISQKQQSNFFRANPMQILKYFCPKRFKFEFTMSGFYAYAYEINALKDCCLI